MILMFCPGCAAVMEQEPRVINGESIMFWVCPEGDWEEPVEPEELAKAETQAEDS